MTVKEVYDGWITYYVNVETGEKYFTLPENATIIKWEPDDFYRG